MTVKLMTDNLTFVGKDYMYVNAITEINFGVYLGIQKYDSQSNYEGPSKIYNAETVSAPYVSDPRYRQLITDEH